MSREEERKHRRFLFKRRVEAGDDACNEPYENRFQRGFRPSLFDCVLIVVALAIFLLALMTPADVLVTIRETDPKPEKPWFSNEDF
ncbi:hypothetical protein ACO34A_24490 (plasmid) [Rhizobium sp. ACO-34A]|nr:hypothetical protein ACO34A_24490 [Rhizobium sp. ACO-34A]